MKKLTGITTGLALTLGLLVGPGTANERFAALADIPAEAMSTADMEQVQGKISSSDKALLMMVMLLNQQQQSIRTPSPNLSRQAYQNQVMLPIQQQLQLVGKPGTPLNELVGFNNYSHMSKNFYRYAPGFQGGNP